MNSKYATSVQLQSHLLKLWKTRVLEIDGQMISILDKGVVKTSFNFKNGSVTVFDQTNHLEIKPAQGHRILIALSNPLVCSQLLKILTAAATSATWSTPQVPLQEKLFSVVDAVRSAPTISSSCGVLVSEVEEHLKAIKIMYNRIQTFESPLDLYSFLLDLEATYVNNYRNFVMTDATQPHCLPHTVYQLHPLLYTLGTNPQKPPKNMISRLVAVCINCKREMGEHLMWRMYRDGCEAQCDHCGEYQTATSYYKSRLGTTAFDIPLRQVLGKCPHRSCGYRFTLEERYRIHILDQALACPQCHNTILYETFQIAMFIRHCPYIDYKSETHKRDALEWRFQTPALIPSDGLWSTYSEVLQEAIRNDPHKDDMEGIPQFRDVAHMAMMEKYCQPSGAFALDIVQGMYRQLDFITKIGPVYEYWSQPVVIEAAIQRYEQFIYLHKKNPKLQGVPTMEIALVWQTHLTKRSDYIKYSRDITKRILPYFDALAPASIEGNYLKTSVAWSKLYNQAYSSFVPQNMTILSMEKAGAIVPQGESRFCGVDEYVLASDMKIDNASAEKVMVSVIGCPSFDDRVHLQGTKQNKLLEQTYGKEHKKSIAKPLSYCKGIVLTI